MAYINNKAFDDEHYKKMIVAFIQKYGAASRKELDGLIIEKLSTALTDKQKIKKIGNLISALRIQGKVKNNGSDKKSSWVISPIN